MKLTIRRDQAAKTGLFGGHKGMRFSLYSRVEISSDEQALIDKYKVNEHVLTYKGYRERTNSGFKNSRSCERTNTRN